MNIATIAEYADTDDVAVVLPHQFDYVAYGAAGRENVFGDQDVFVGDIFVVATSEKKAFVGAVAAFFDKDSQGLATLAMLIEGMGNPL